MACLLCVVAVATAAQMSATSRTPPASPDPSTPPVRVGSVFVDNRLADHGMARVSKPGSVPIGPHSVDATANRAGASTRGRTLFVDPDRGGDVRWTLACDDIVACRGAVQTMADVALVNPTSGLRVALRVHHRNERGGGDGNVGHETGVVGTHGHHGAWRCAITPGHIASNTAYIVEIKARWMVPVAVAPGAGDSNGTTHAMATGVATARVAFRTALRSADWPALGAAGIGGGTALRARFTLPANRHVKTATTFVSGVGCVDITVNGVRPDNASFLNPGWANLPTVRMLYSAYDVTSLVHAGGDNAIGLRLGMCKYGYQGAFCEGAGGATARCRGAIVVMTVSLDDGTVVNITTTPPAHASTNASALAPVRWEATSTENEVVYDHLYNGEIRDGRVGDPDWDTPRASPVGTGWAPAEPFHNADQLGTTLTLRTMPPMAATAETAPVSVTRITPHSPQSPVCNAGPTHNVLAAMVPAGGSANLTCAEPSATIKGITYAAFGTGAGFDIPRGRFIGGTVGNACADTRFPTGCIFYENFVNKSRHFVTECVTQPCGANACGNFTAIGAGITSLVLGANFSCDMVSPSCALATCDACCNVTRATAAVAAQCVGRHTCTLTADPAAFGDACGGGGGGASSTRALVVVASGCTPVTPAPPPAYVFDFGMNQAGFATLRVKGPRGARVVLKYAEVLNPDGTVKMDWCGGAEGAACVCTGINCANQTDAYTLRGDQNGEVFTPLFTYHGFRYVQVEGWPSPEPPTASALTALFVHTAMTPTGAIRLNSSVLQGIQHAYVYTQLSNVHSHPTDCPTREKRGWTGDSQLTSGGATLNFDTATMYGNWLVAMHDHQTVDCSKAGHTPVFPQANVDVCCDPPNNGFGCDYTGVTGGRFANTSGALADVVPFTHVGGWPGDPNWMLAGVVVPWEVAVKTGNVAFAEAHYGTAKALVDFQTRYINPAVGLITWGYYGDWLSLEPIPHAQVTGWGHILGVSHLVDLANLTGRANDAAMYGALLTELKMRYHKAYFDATKGYYAGGSQTAQVLPLLLDIPPDGATTASTVAQLVRSLAARANTTSSGIVGTAYLLQVLHAHAPELAFAIASSTTAPSWGHMVNVGPGTIWESWTDSTNSHNHPALGATVSKYLYQIAGFDGIDDASVWRTGIIRLRPPPRVAHRVGSANATLRTVHGPVGVHWVAGDAGTMDITTHVPIGLSADVHVGETLGPRCEVTSGDGTVRLWPPARDGDAVQRCGPESPSCLRVFSDTSHRDGIATVVVRVPSGTHTFRQSCRPPLD
eukprot:m.14055 g.14055  ORF g.14055 m.14055 type:complete len:1286 (-) comp3115_c0_seq1:253-4110(-)